MPHQAARHCLATFILDDVVYAATYAVAHLARFLIGFLHPCLVLRTAIANLVVLSYFHLVVELLSIRCFRFCCAIEIDIVRGCACVLQVQRLRRGCNPWIGIIHVPLLISLVVFSLGYIACFLRQS